MNPIIAQSFTADDCLGNPAAVVVLDTTLTAKEMKKIAAEQKLPITCFVRKTVNGPLPLRAFTPTTEVGLCGHGMLATAAVLFRWHYKDVDSLSFKTRPGIWTAVLQEERIELELPMWEVSPTTFPEAMSVAFPGIHPQFVCSFNDLIVVVVDSPATVLALEPNFKALPKTAWGDWRTLAVTAAGGPQADYTCRVFAPLQGVFEDAATGSVQMALIPYWSKLLGQQHLRGWQASSRGGRFVGDLLPGQLLRLSGQVRVE